MSKANAPQVAKLLREHAQRTALRGGNPYYRAKAYSRAADSLAALAEPLDRLVEEERLTEIPGVGEAIADIITKLHGTGTHPSLEKLRKELPDGVLEMLTVPGLRPEKVLRLYKDLGNRLACGSGSRGEGRPHQEGEGTRCSAADQGPAESCDLQGR